MADPAIAQTLAAAHMRSQVGRAATFQAALSRYWDELIDPADFAASFERFRQAALPLIEAARLQGVLGADAYYRALLAVDRLQPGPTPAIPAFNKSASLASLSAAVRGPGYVAMKLAAKGANAEQILAAAKAAMLRSAKRQILNASRSRLLDRQAVDPNVKGWARVSDGNPCAFCALLVSRGPVYAVDTAHFAAHDGCGCSARLVLRTDADGGWSREAKRYRALYEEGWLQIGAIGKGGKLRSVRWDTASGQVPTASEVMAHRAAQASHEDDDRPTPPPVEDMAAPFLKVA